MSWMNAVLKLLRNFAEQLFKASATISSYWSSAVLFIVLMCGEIPLNNENQLLDLFYSAKLY